jgi:hypothetical protein
MISALLMLRRVVGALRYAVREEEFLPILSAGLLLVGIGTVGLRAGRELARRRRPVLRGGHADDDERVHPDLVLDDRWLKLFTILYQLVGIGILVEVLRRLGLAFVTVRTQAGTPPPPDR